MRYTAAIIQPDHLNVWQRKTIKKNLDTYLNLIDFACTSAGTTTARAKKEPYAPVKLVAFPEFFLQGFTTAANIKRYKQEILIEIPGEETDKLGEKAKEHNIYICGAALEHLPPWEDAFFNCAFVISPNGDVIHKYHKYNPAAQWEMSTSPHDVFEEYMNEYGKESVLKTFFPVTKTEIGNIGTFICMDGHFPEVARCLALNGAEVLIRPTAFPEPITYEPKNLWEIENRARAIENLAYVVAPNTGGMRSEEHVQTFPRAFCPGDSMIVDYEGVITGRTQYPGESLTSAVIDIEALRSRRKEPSRNFPSLLRTEAFVEIYKNSIYPPNKYEELGWEDSEDLIDRSPSNLGIIKRFLKEGIYQE